MTSNHDWEFGMKLDLRGLKEELIDITLSVCMAESSHLELEVLSKNNSPERSNCGSGGLYW